MQFKNKQGKMVKASYSHLEAHASLSPQLNSAAMQNILNPFPYLNWHKSQMRLPLFSLSK